jgi:ABC-type sulfate/molybdate transport systems ATPase subunit
VITSHDPRTALAEADLVLGLHAGRPRFLGPPEELDEPTTRELYR